MLIRFIAIVPLSNVLLASDFSTEIPRLKFRVIKILFDEIDLQNLQSQATNVQIKTQGSLLGFLYFLPFNSYFLTLNYQILIRSSGFLYNLSPGFTLNALYQASMFTGVPMVRNCAGECGSV